MRSRSFLRSARALLPSTSGPALARRPASFGALQTHLQSELQQIRDAGLYKNERVITSPQRAEISVEGSEQPVLNFCANNYLGLSDSPVLEEAAANCLRERGFGLSSVRFICGTQDIHKELEKAISEFHGTEDTILYPSCFDANAGLFEALLTKEDAIISDALNHASIIDGIRLCKATRRRYAHLDMADLEAQLESVQDSRFKLIATDGAFSMDGDVAPLDEIVALAKKHDAHIFIDECHATGFFGPTGRGTPEHFGLDASSDLLVINSTLGKALGGATGGYTTGPQEVIDLLRQRARPYLFSNSIAPPVVSASLEVFKMLQQQSAPLEQLKANTTLFRTRMKAAGFTVSGNDAHPIAPVMLGDAKLAGEMAQAMLKKDIYVIAFSFPVVPRGEARIRVQLSAAHSTEQVDRCVDAFVEIGREMGVIA